jgi:pantoate--beta-alanine ligase
MIIFKTEVEISKFLSELHQQGTKTGFVPTMGALHEGHISLINNCKANAEVTICSVFVNPTQFNNPVDFEKYPISIESDIDMLEKAGCDILFIPSTAEIYPTGFQTTHYELGYLEEILEGQYRPGHFQGVCMVVERLIKIINPTLMLLGQKDYQQCMVIAKMIAIRNLSTKLIISPTVREKSGLAMSSRNRRMNEDDLKKSVAIYESLIMMKENLKVYSLEELKLSAIKMLQANGFKIDYVDIRTKTLNALSKIDDETAVVGLIAASINEIRLIDNMMLNE